MSDSKKISRTLLSLLVLKAAPQDLPYSLGMTVRLSFFYVLSGLFVLQTTLEPDDMVAGILLGLLVQYVFAYTILTALNKSARFMQTFSAMVGVSLVFNLISLVMGDLGLPVLSKIFSYGWLTLVLYSWVGIPMYQRKLEKELQQFRFNDDF